MQLARVLGRWARYDVIAIDEVGDVPLAEVGAELLFQIDCAEKHGRRRAPAVRVSDGNRVLVDIQTNEKRCRLCPGGPPVKRDG